MQESKRFNFVFEQDGQDKQLWIHASGFAAAYDKFWSKMDGEDIDKIEVEEHTLKPVEGTPEVFEWIPDGII